MASAYTSVDLSALPAPKLIEELDFETVLAAMLADLRARDSTFTALLESDPAYKQLEVSAYREILIRQRVNQAATDTMLAYATGSDLDQVAARYDVERLIITEEDLTTIPPTAAVYESDDDFRYRILLSIEGYTTAGSRGAYKFHSLSASGQIKDVNVKSLTPGTVNVAVMSRDGNGVADSALLNTVTLALSDETVRPLCDTVVVQSVSVQTYAINASLYLYPGVGQDEVIASSLQAAQEYATAQHKIGRDVTLSGLYAALHQPGGVQRAELISPTADIIIDWNQTAYCTGVTVSYGGTDE